MEVVQNLIKKYVIFSVEIGWGEQGSFFNCFCCTELGINSSGEYIEIAD